MTDSDSDNTGAPLWAELCGKAAPIAAIVVFMAPIPTIRKISSKRSVGSLPLLPYSSMVASAFLWLVYGVLKQESIIWSANLVGLALGTYYFIVFIRYSPEKAPTLPGSIMQHVQGCFAVAILTVVLTITLPTMQAATIIGHLGVLFGVAMFASPLAALRTVLETQSAKSIPLPFTLASVLNCFLWSVVGLLDMLDFNIYAPNLLGLSFGLVQVALKLQYGNGSETSPRYTAGETSDPVIDIDRWA